MKKTLSTILLSLLAVVGSAQVLNDSSALIGEWVGKLSFGANSLTLVLHIEQKEGFIHCSFDSPDQGAKGLGCYKNKLTHDALSLSIPQIGASYNATLENEQLVGTFTQGGVNLPLTMKRGEYKPPRPQTPQEPYPYTSEEVQFFNKADSATLAGTLTYPIGYDGSKRVPVVIMISGSGLQNRDEEIFSHKPFLVIADHLARNGIASLRYDDRGFGASTAGNRSLNKATTLDYKRDAAAGIEYLRGLQRFGAVGALGHSEGGNIVFMLGAEQCVDFVISLAGLGVKGDEALTAQYNHIMRSQGAMHEVSVEQYRKIALASPTDWMSWLLDYDPAADISATTCPAFAVNGAKDCQVISSLNLSAIQRLLPYNEHSSVKEYPSLNHLFQPCQTGLPTEYNTIEQTISPELLQDMSAWIHSLSMP